MWGGEFVRFGMFVGCGGWACGTQGIEMGFVILVHSSLGGLKGLVAFWKCPDPHWSSWWGNILVSHLSNPGTTSFCGIKGDQAGVEAQPPSLGRQREAGEKMRNPLTLPTTFPPALLVIHRDTFPAGPADSYGKSHAKRLGSCPCFKNGFCRNSQWPKCPC